MQCVKNKIKPGVYRLFELSVPDRFGRIEILDFLRNQGC